MEKKMMNLFTPLSFLISLGKKKRRKSGEGNYFCTFSLGAPVYICEPVVGPCVYLTCFAETVYLTTNGHIPNEWLLQQQLFAPFSPALPA